MPSDVYSIRERNLMFFGAIEDILGLSRGKTWEDVRRELSDEQVERIHATYASLWPSDTQKHGDLENLRTERSVIDADLSRARGVLDRALVDCALTGLMTDETAAGALARAQQAVSAARKAKAERDSVSDQMRLANLDLRDLQNQRQRGTARLTEWRLSWSAATGNLRLSADALPSEAKTRLVQFSRLGAALSELAKLDTDSNSHGAVITAFTASVTEIASAVEEAAEGQDPDVLAEGLYACLRETRGAETKRQQIASDIERETWTLTEAEFAAQQARKTLDELIHNAGCLTLDKLPDIEQKAVRKQVLEQRLLEVDEQLVQQNARPIIEVVREADGLALDDILRQIADVASAVEDLEGQIEGAQGALFGAKNNLAAIDGGPAAAEAQQAVLSLGARIAKEARSYARVRLASAVLGRVVQIYRDQHQGPPLVRAAEVFARITLGSFAGLTVDYEDDRQVLLGVRPDATRVPVAGMSQGTRDQLFLSLRLAAIEQHIEGRGPFPVIVDDLLVQFDDDCAVATLEVLSELSGKTQVLFFTHHKHLVDLAGKSALGTVFSVQSL